ATSENHLRVALVVATGGAVSLSESEDPLRVELEVLAVCEGHRLQMNGAVTALLDADHVRKPATVVTTRASKVRVAAKVMPPRLTAAAGLAPSARASSPAASAASSAMITATVIARMVRTVV
ncbi:hypothetical protein ABZ490_51250, partial [Streptomyces sp. NPDC005811]|uniref:hypothetical protein n=1 Tax=Streptomyces sp. NPDC005811 TaxID=3154565 RepID=UPI0033EF842D